MRKIAANFVYPVTSPPIKNGILVLDNNNTIVEIIDPGLHFKEIAGCEFYNGVLVPGFINSHCHLELSYLRGTIPIGMGMRNFLRCIIHREHKDEQQILDKAEQADRYMAKTGTVAVADISNQNITIDVKFKSSIYYHTFVEVTGLDKAHTNERLTHALRIRDSLTTRRMPCSITPHAPYSINSELLEEIAKLSENNLLSLHILENSVAMEKLTENSESLASFFEEIGIKNSLHQDNHPYCFLISPFRNKTLFLVHNLYATPEDWQLLEKISCENFLRVFLVTCPRSNYYIHRIIPDYTHWPQNFSVCLGTDSLASNFDLSIFNEIIFLLSRTQFSFDQILPWATINGAIALGIDKQYGSFEIGKTPGVNLISGFNFSKGAPDLSSKIYRIV